MSRGKKIQMRLFKDFILIVSFAADTQPVPV